jgi:Leucine-rich repeat (LRR) protein
VINKNLKESDLNYAVVILVDYDWRNNVQFRLADGSNSGRFAGTTVMPWSEIIQKIPNLKGKEKYFVPHPFPAEQQSMMMSFERKNLTTNDAIKELGSEENVELWLELRTPDLSTTSNGALIWANFTPYLRHKYIGMDGKLTGPMLKVSDDESKGYYLSKKRKSLLLTDIDKLTEADVSLIMSDEMAPYHEALINAYSEQLSKKNLDLSYLPITFPTDAAAKFAMMFGLEVLFEMLPEDTKFINLENKSDKVEPFHVPANISRFKNLKTLVADNIIKSLPESIGECKMLGFLNVTGNKELTTLPKSIANLHCLTFLSVMDSNIDIEKLPKELFKYMIPTEDFFIVNFPKELREKRGCPTS